MSGHDLLGALKRGAVSRETFDTEVSRADATTLRELRERLERFRTEMVEAQAIPRPERQPVIEEIQLRMLAYLQPAVWGLREQIGENDG